MNNAHGGKRIGSGRKPLDPLGSVAVSVWMTRRQRANLKRLGGAKWVRDLIDQAIFEASKSQEISRRIAEVRQASASVVILKSRAGGKVKWVSAQS